eukprot:gene6701-7463_t
MMLNPKLLAFSFGILHIVIVHTGAETCSDVQQWCSYWKNEGYCSKSHQFYSYMTSNCKKSCGFCRVDPCGAVPCKNGATCTPNGSSFTCKCKLGYEGKLCEIVNPCAKQPCKNGGSCTRQGSKFTCKCKDGFEGTTCEKKVVTAKECKNSAQYDKQCPVWKNALFCKPGNQWYGFMTDHCSKECGFCKKICKNDQTADYCNRYKQYCKHPQYGKIITNSCKKTCGGCEEPPCGQGPDKLQRVVGGTDAEPNDWPWQAMLTSNGKYYCGGTLIAKQWVVTAGHCLRGKTADQLGVVLGEHIRDKVEGPEQSFKVTQIVRHPDYDPSTKDSDIALLRLDKEAQLNKQVSLACLPTEPPLQTQLCYITGAAGKENGVVLVERKFF